LQLGLQLWRDGLLVFNWWQTSRLTVTKGIFTLLVIHIRQHAQCWVEGGFDLDDGGLQTTRSHATRDIDFYLDHVTRNDDGRASWGTGQDNIARLQGHVLRQVCNKLRQRGDQIFVGGAVFLHNVAIDPGAQAQRLGVDTVRIDKLTPNEGLAIGRLGTGIRACILRAVVVYTDIIGRGHIANALPRLVNGDVARRLAHDHCDFTLTPQHVSAGRAFYYSVKL